MFHKGFELRQHRKSIWYFSFTQVALSQFKDDSKPLKLKLKLCCSLTLLVSFCNSFRCPTGWVFGQRQESRLRLSTEARIRINWPCCRSASTAACAARQGRRRWRQLWKQRKRWRRWRRWKLRSERTGDQPWGLLLHGSRIGEELLTFTPFLYMRAPCLQNAESHAVWLVLGSGYQVVWLIKSCSKKSMWIACVDRAKFDILKWSELFWISAYPGIPEDHWSWKKIHSAKSEVPRNSGRTWNPRKKTFEEFAGTQEFSKNIWVAPRHLWDTTFEKFVARHIWVAPRHIWVPPRHIWAAPTKKVQMASWHVGFNDKPPEAPV